MDRRRLMSAVNIGRTLALVLLLVSLATDTAALPMLYVTAFSSGWEKRRTTPLRRLRCHSWFPSGI